jgi:hypothetical protein
MNALRNLAIAYFRRRILLRVILLITISSLWAYSEISEFFVIHEHDLNYQAIQKIQSRYKGGAFSFAVVGDTKNSPVFDEIINKINQDDTVLFVVVLGDLVFYPTVDTYRSFLQQRAVLHAPSIVIPGNHDIAFKNHFYYHEIFSRFYYSFVLGNSQFIMLDNSNELQLGEEQSGWLRKQLSDGQRYQNRFVFMHVPIWDPRGKNEFGVPYGMGDTDAARILEDLLVANKVSLVFESHIHGYYDLPGKELHRIITGRWCGLIRCRTGSCLLSLCKDYSD